MIDTPSAATLAAGDANKPVGMLIALILLGCVGALLAAGLTFNVRGLRDTFVRRQALNKQIQAQQTGNLGLLVAGYESDIARFAKTLGWLLIVPSAVLILTCTIILIV